MLRCSHDFACETSLFGLKLLAYSRRVEAKMLIMKVGYLATGLAFLFVGAVTMGLF